MVSGAVRDLNETVVGSMPLATSTNSTVLSPSFRSITRVSRTTPYPGSLFCHA